MPKFPKKQSMPLRPWRSKERAYYRDLLRSARYIAFEDAEGFGQICFALEELGQRLLGENQDLNTYKSRIGDLAKESAFFDSPLTNSSGNASGTFGGLYEIVRLARNDAMHTGARARRATDAAVELCLGLEDALMASVPDRIVGDFMVRNPTTVEDWNLVARARQLMLMHSFSFLPLKLGTKWVLVSEMSMVKFLSVKSDTRKERLAMTITEAIQTPDGLETVTVRPRGILRPDTVTGLLLAKSKVSGSPMLWLVIEKGHLVGVLSPFDLI